MDSETRQCQNCKKDFIIEPDDFNFYEKIKVPPPTFCPECRDQRRNAFRNERALFKRKCDLCGQIVISRVSPDKPYPMYCKECWWSDKWDSLSFGRDYDFSKSFFEQFKELLNNTPHVSIFNANIVNSDWVNQETDDKNCFLNVGGHYNEDCAYNTYSLYGKNCLDNYWILNSELCYENLNCERCYKTFYSSECLDCMNVMLSYDCRKCTNVIGCAGLRNKQYYIFNKPYSKEEYEAFLRNNSIKSYKKFLELYKRANEVWLSVPHRFSLIVHSINSAGNYINESKNALNCWNLEKSENAKNIYIGGWLKDSFDESAHGASELGYECASGGGVYNSKFLNFCMSNSPLQGFHSSDMEYCYSVISSKSCFGCANMRNQEYCILNKRYTKEEYEKFVSQIKKQMQEMPYVGKNGRIYSYGEFFPIEISPFGYNETSAQDWHPVTREEALAKGYLWSDYKTDTKHQISDYEIPDNIDEVQDDVLTKILKCSTSGNPYKIISMELQFLRRMGLPLPRKSPTERHNERIHKLLPHKLFRRTCANCNVQIETPYAPNRPEIVYCESCYNQEIN